MSPDESRCAQAAIGGSFRDRDGRVYIAESRVFRGLSSKALEDYEALSATRFHQRFADQGRLIHSTLVPLDVVPLPEREKRQWAAFLEHPRIPVISYPYEWTFGMLREAALLQLDLTQAAISEDIGLKDATPYNIQFVDGQPIFIDIGSFERRQQGEPWAGYRQFCEMFLFPLMLQSYKGLDFQPLLRGSIDGIVVPNAARLFGFRDRFRRGVFSHVWLQSKLDRRYGGTTVDMRSELKSAGFSHELILANLRKLKRLVSGLDWEGDGSEWGAYEEFHNYSDHDARLKETFVEQAVSDSGADTVWDIGCNTGRFSRIAARHARSVLAMDQDHFAVERLYRELGNRTGDADAQSILTLVQDIADPSPNWGWRNRERSELGARAKPDLVLCLALIHHVVISAHIPLPEFIDWLAGLTDQVVIEFVSRDDDKVQALLRNKRDSYSDYGREPLEAALRHHYEIVRQQPLESGKRFLYWCRRA